MPDTDPEYEIGNTECPTNRNIVTPNSNPGEQQVQDTKDSEGRDGSGYSDRDKPPERRFALRDAGDKIRDPRHRTVVLHQRWPRHAFHERNHLRGRDLGFSHYAFPPVGTLVCV